jgi:Transposase DDE domain/Domain of unknown function (DUF4372)
MGPEEELTLCMDKQSVTSTAIQQEEVSSMKRFCSIMNQLLQFFPRAEFETFVKETKAERHARGFSSWDQFVAMMFCQVGDAQSLREICGGLSSCGGRLQQLGVKAPAKSTLSYANAHRPWELFEKVFYGLYQRCQAEVGTNSKLRIKKKLLSIDSTHVSLCSEAFPWAKYSRQKGAVKLHFTLNHAGYLPAAMVITTGNYSELLIARKRPYEAGTVLTFDRGYVDFEWFGRLQQQRVCFVTRLKKQMRYEIVEERPIHPGSAIVSDQVVRFTAKATRKRYPGLLRIVTIETEAGERLEFLTNQMTWAASTIAAIYKDRWQIESFFKMLKQNLRIKSFVGISSNAVWIQIWTALIAMLLIKFLQLKAQFGWSFSNLVYFLRMNLLVYRDLWEWLNKPFSPPEEIVAKIDSAQPTQLDMAWS